MNQVCKEIRKKILYMHFYAHASHIGSSYSIVEILYTLYFKVMNISPDNIHDKSRDRFLLSKGHSCSALYAVLCMKGFFPDQYLNEFETNGGKLPGHVDKDAAPGIECSSGSLGHGLSVGTGMALNNKLSNLQGRIFVLMGDGECDEGSVWEAAMLASQKKLNNLTVIIDKNNLQGFGSTKDILEQDTLKERFVSFGWDVYEVDGHNIEELEKVFAVSCKKPKAVIAHTIKGKGVSFMENKLEWHYKSPNKEQYLEALAELERK